MDAREILKGTVISDGTLKITEEALLFSAVTLLRKVVKTGREINCVPEAAETLNKALSELFALRKQIGTMPMEIAIMVDRAMAESGRDQVTISFSEIDELMAAGKQLRYHVDKELQSVIYTIEDRESQATEIVQ
jgi:Xaa-Pro aminopeptidase